MIRTILKTALAIAATLAVVQAGTAADPSEKDKKLLKEVADKLLAVCEPMADFDWPPDIAIDGGKEINAYATLARKGGKIVPIVRVFDGMMKKVIEGDADRLAFILGHELGHLVKKHVVPDRQRDKTPFLSTTFTRGQEIEADVFGTELMLKAGYSFRKGTKAITKMQDMGLEYSSFEGLGLDHPSWNDRLAKMDKDQPQFWRAMSAFGNGVLFLATEQYPQAEKCFDKVTREFPACYEAWANLGYARLMQYCDGLDKKDLEQLGIGQIITGGFYRRVTSVPVRGMNTEIWQGAIRALNESNKLKPGQTLVLANLGLAQLVNPKGKDAAEATRLLTAAVAAAKDDKDVRLLEHAGLLVNLGVATVAGGNTDTGLEKLDEGEKIIGSMFGGGKRPKTTYDTAILYTKALVMSRKPDKADREKSLALFEDYLDTSSPLSLYWPMAYEQYKNTCSAVGREPKKEAKFKADQPVSLRLVSGVTLKSGAQLTLGEDTAEAVKKLGRGKESVAVPGTNLKRIRFEKDGVELLATEDDVLAITLVGSTPLPLRGRGVGAAKVGELKVGMNLKEVEQLLGDDYQPCEMVTARMYYLFFREQGIAIRLVRGLVTEIVVVQMPGR